MSTTLEAGEAVPNVIVRFMMDGNTLRIQTSRKLDVMARISLITYLANEGYIDDQFRFYTGSSYGYGYGDAGMTVVWSLETPEKLVYALLARPEPKIDYVVWVFGAVILLSCLGLIWSLFSK